MAEVGLERLPEVERVAVVDAMVAGADLPIVLVEGEVACTDRVDAVAVVSAAARVSSRG